jgi:uracil-DNA glycosylase family 4
MRTKNAARSTLPRSGRTALARIERAIPECAACPRLRRHCAEVASSKRRAFRDWTYWGRPVPGFGDPHARLWIIGLAPAAHGANRTGRMFTGDASGDWLFRALHAHGFARLPTSTTRADGQRLNDAYISAVARCAPPGNRPSPDEIDRCAAWLAREHAALGSVRVVVALGQIAHTRALHLFAGAGYLVPRPRPRFAHAARTRLVRDRSPRAPLTLVASYHPSRQNTQTGRLTRPMLDAVFAAARGILAQDATR